MESQLKIQFRPFNKETDYSEIKPTPIIRVLPDWFRAMPRFMPNEKSYKHKRNGEQTGTVKWCQPFIDSMGAGYTIKLENDIQVTIENGERHFVWKRGGDLILAHSVDQITQKMIPSGYAKAVYKFNHPWGISTPKGYSCLFVAPLNRPDLPFQIISGTVDTDTYHNPVNFPFFIKDDFEGIIEAGTPLAQIIPFKRESWQSQVLPYDPEYVAKTNVKFFSKMYRTYKKLYWTRKEYR